MLRIQPVCYEMVRDVEAYAEKIALRNRNHAEQLRGSAVSVALNVGEGSGQRGGNRRLKYEYALGSARETVANLEVAAAIGYIDGIDVELRNRFDHIIGVLVKILF